MLDLITLNSDGVLWPYPDDAEGRDICIEAEKQFRFGFRMAAKEALALTPDNNDPHYDIFINLGLYPAWGYRRLATSALYNKKLRRLEIDAFHTGNRAKLEYYRNSYDRAVRHALRRALLRGRVHALEYIKQAYFDTDYPDPSPYNDWDYFHPHVVVPWAKEVLEWSKPKSYDFVLPPDLIAISQELAKQEHIKYPNSRVQLPKLLPKEPPRPWQPQPAPAKAEMVTIPLSTVTAKEIQWFWPNRIPAGMLSLLVGNPGAGKSFLTMYICSMITTGRDWSDSKNELPAGSVLLFSNEESLEYPIKPRLVSHQADCSKIFAVPHIKRADGNPEPFTIDEHIQLLREKLCQIPDCRVIIFDPITAYLGAVNANDNAEVRGALVGLQGLAQERNVTILGINHFSKKAELDAIHRILGSTGFVAAARAVWAVIFEKREEDDDKDPARLLIPVKSNYSISPTTLRFQINDGQVVFDEQQQRVDIDAILQNAKKTGGRQSNKKDAIVNWLTERVGSHPVLAEDIKAEADGKNFNWRYVQDIANDLGVRKSKSTEHGGKYVWQYEP